MNWADSSTLVEVWVFGGWGCKPSGPGTRWWLHGLMTISLPWFRLNHTGTSSETGWNLLGTGLTMDPDRFSPKVSGVLRLRDVFQNNRWSFQKGIKTVGNLYNGLLHVICTYWMYKLEWSHAAAKFWRGKSCYCSDALILPDITLHKCFL